ncbi:oxidoreductase [Massilia violaceinigra]|uniref:Oxidoreductase n=1 Tax=Massilia violaceinigra TaxID=2045208 RepID=A0A2D2DP81_9BURK|nr:glucose 1-dehydrogenase [Massilia violaceinigra]ATQ76781.1 oxidoreductase [Massilia violaceinigra]
MVNNDVKVALITGGGTGIGRSAALAFARAGYRVAVVGRRLDRLDTVVATIRRAGGEGLAIQGDVANDADAAHMVQQTVAHFGRLDAAFNSAGVEGTFAPIVDLTANDFDQTMSINLRGVWLSCKYEIAAMTRLGNGGAIVNTSSWLAQGAFPGTSIYSASKAALDGMIRALAQETATDGIRVNNVQPGIIDTPMLRRFGGDSATQPFINHTPARRLGEPEDVADVVTWLCSDAARFITGQSVMVDGGYAIAGHRAWLSGAVSSVAAEA